jgi:chromosome segregation ATPase
MSVAAALPSVESSLEDFISRANSTPDAGGWGIAADSATQEQRAAEIAQIEAEADRRRQQDQARWKAAETQLKSEAEVRENALKKQLDVLQGKLAAAEARAAVAADTDDGAAATAAMAQLQNQLAKAEDRAKSAEAAAKASQAKINEMAAEAAAGIPNYAPPPKPPNSVPKLPMRVLPKRLQQRVLRQLG